MKSGNLDKQLNTLTWHSSMTRTQTNNGIPFPLIAIWDKHPKEEGQPGVELPQ